jgi:endonuclease YncB( thermonuclease family)
LQPNKSKVADFNGKVVEVHSGDSMTIEKEPDQSHIRVYLSSIKAPAIGKVSKQGETPGEPYSWDSKESLRKIAIGKKVHVEMEYSRTIQTKDGSDLTMNFAAVFLTQKDKNVACM